MKTWIVSSRYEEAIQGEETIQGRKLYEEIRYLKFITEKVSLKTKIYKQRRSVRICVQQSAGKPMQR